MSTLTGSIGTGFNTCDIEEVSWTYNMRINYGRPQEKKPAGHGEGRGRELLVSRT